MEWILTLERQEVKQLDASEVAHGLECTLKHD